MYEALPKRLATLRRSKAMSQEELANILGVSRQAVSKWERGESSPDTLNLIGLADLYEMSLDELVRGASAQEKNGEEAASTCIPKADIPKAESEDTTGNEAVISPNTQNIPSAVSNQADAVNQAQSQPQPQAPGGAPDYPPPTDTAYQYPTAPPPPSPFSATPNPFETPMGTPAGHYPITPQGPTVPQHKSKHGKPQGVLMRFPYPIFCVIMYLIMGFVFSAWHPGWIIFLTIPIYYWIAEIVEKDPIYQLRRQQREALLRSQINLIEQGAIPTNPDPSNPYPPTY